MEKKRQMTTHGKGVWCNICPLKDYCIYSQSDSCYRVSRLVNYKDNVVKERDFDKQKEATKNCPLLPKIIDIDSLELSMLRDESKK